MPTAPSLPHGPALVLTTWAVASVWIGGAKDPTEYGVAMAAGLCATGSDTTYETLFSCTDKKKLRRSEPGN